jgi:two-component sensor histidine kinase
MQVLQSLMRMTERGVSEDSRPVFKELSRRIWAMAQVHTQVYASGEPSKLSLGEYLGRLCGYLSQSFGRAKVQLRYSVDAVEIDLDSAIPIGLIAVECIQNAYKHAFPGGRAGDIWVELTRDGELAKLLIRDSGVGAQPNAVRRSTGLSLVEALVSQIDGTMQITSDRGTTINIAFPVRLKESRIGGLPNEQSEIRAAQ